jgi:hypothetical protein
LSAADLFETVSERDNEAGHAGRHAKQLCVDELARISSRMFRVASRAFPITRRFMTDYLELNVEALSKTLRQQASGFRQLAGESVEGGFQSRLLVLAQDYDRQAESLERVNLPPQ